MTINQFLNPSDHSDPRLDLRRRARSLYFQCWSIKAIALELAIPEQTIYSWKRREDWDNFDVMQKINLAIEARLQALIALPALGNGEKAHIDFLITQMAKVAKIDHYKNTGKLSALHPDISKRNDAPRTKNKGQFSPEDLIRLEECFLDNLFDYQKLWLEARENHRIRNLLKSRQIGATWYFAREHAFDAIQTGDPQIFLSASKAQAHVFRRYIIDYVREATSQELKGEVINLANGANLHFLGTNTRTAQGYHGHVMMDEYFWIYGFTDFRKVASGMAMHKKWRQTYSSTPSAITHEAYDFWAAKKHEAKHGVLDISHQALAAGKLCHDGQWRQIVTIHDAIAGGCDLFDLDQLRLEYSDSEFSNLLECEFMDDSMSEFPLSLIMPCACDAWEDWTDYKPFAPKPLGNLPVSIGYDPSLGGDSAAIVVWALPDGKHGKFRKIEHHLLNQGPEAQADKIKALTKIYNVIDIGMDTKGCGAAAHLLVKQFFPHVRTYNYTPQIKYLLVAKAQELFRAGRIAFDCGDREFTTAMGSIKRTTTASGNGITYTSGRRGNNHGDLGWASLHVFGIEPLGALNETDSKIITSEVF